MLGLNTITNLAATSTSALRAQVQRLEQSCADWEACTTTSTSDKQKIVGSLSQQIQSLNTEIQQQESSGNQSTLRPVNAVNATANLGDGVNRPQDGEIIGSLINLSV